MGLWRNEEAYTGQALSSEDWKQLFRLAHSQGVTGLFIDGVSQDSMRPDNGLWDKWVAHLFFLEQANRYIAQRGEAWIGKLAEAGISATVFKGASVATWYPEPLHRSLGDVDIVITEGWNRLEGILTEEGRNLFRKDEDEVVLEEKNQLMVEFHRHWECLYNPLTHRRLLQICRSAQPGDKELYFVCLILHIQRHILTYGVGLKQICDVAVMLSRASLDLEKVASLLHRLHAERFSRLLFGFIAVHLGGVEDYPLAPVTAGKGWERLNRAILQEGYHSKIEQERVAGSKSRSVSRMASNAVFWTKRCFSIYRIMPSEACCFLFSKVFKRLRSIKNIYVIQSEAKNLNA
jgi:hypothetical protein